MQFRHTHNPKTGTSRYYINGRRVSYDEYEYQQILCCMSGKRYNSSCVTRGRNGTVQHHHCYN